MPTKAYAIHNHYEVKNPLFEIVGVHIDYDSFNHIAYLHDLHLWFPRAREQEPLYCQLLSFGEDTKRMRFLAIYSTELLRFTTTNGSTAFRGDVLVLKTDPENPEKFLPIVAEDMRNAQTVVDYLVPYGHQNAANGNAVSVSDWRTSSAHVLHAGRVKMLNWTNEGQSVCQDEVPVVLERPTWGNYRSPTHINAYYTDPALLNLTYTSSKEDEVTEVMMSMDEFGGIELPENLTQHICETYD